MCCQICSLYLFCNVLFTCIMIYQKQCMTEVVLGSSQHEDLCEYEGGCCWKRNKCSQSTFSLKNKSHTEGDTSNKKCLWEKKWYKLSTFANLATWSIKLCQYVQFLNYAFVPHKQMCNSHSPCPVLIPGISALLFIAVWKCCWWSNDPSLSPTLSVGKPVLPARLTESQTDRERITELFYSGCGSLILIVVYMV